MGLDEAGTDQAPPDVQDLGVRREAGLDGRDPAAVDADVHRAAVVAAGYPCVSEDEVHGTSPGAGRRPARLMNGSGYPKTAVAGGFGRRIPTEHFRNPL